MIKKLTKMILVLGLLITPLFAETKVKEVKQNDENFLILTYDWNGEDWELRYNKMENLTSQTNGETINLIKWLPGDINLMYRYVKTYEDFIDLINGTYGLHFEDFMDDVRNDFEYNNKKYKTLYISVQTKPIYNKR